MKVSLNWLNDYVDLSDVSIEEISEALPMLGLEVESVQTLGLPPLKNVVVGQILSRDPHPDSDHLGVCMVKVDKDAEPIQIVCGASNYKVGDRVPVALDGAELPTEDGKGFKIKVSKLRGVVSNGMMCSARELGLGSDHSGLLILQNSPEIGTPINDVFTDTDTVFEVELTANRGDCASHIGIARELAAKFSKPLKMPELKAAENYSEKSQSGLLDSVELDTPNCPFYLAACIRDVKIAESPEWMKKRLEAVGLRPINNVVDVTNYATYKNDGTYVQSADSKPIKIDNADLIYFGMSVADFTKVTDEDQYFIQVKEQKNVKIGGTASKSTLAGWADIVAAVDGKIYDYQNGSYVQIKKDADLSETDKNYKTIFNKYSSQMGYNAQKEVSVNGSNASDEIKGVKFAFVNEDAKKYGSIDANTGVITTNATINESDLANGKAVVGVKMTVEDYWGMKMTKTFDVTITKE